uniref:Uncharacterized protein n=1 Tax=Arundo donax TaxID=35708 RepID=A0A0A8ZT09_ARUDO
MHNDLCNRNFSKNAPCGLTYIMHHLFPFRFPVAN